MLRISLAAAAAAIILLTNVPAQAGGNAPWCAVIGLGRGLVYWDCQYATLEQCVPNVIAGNRGFCNQNPAYEAGPPVRPRRPVRHY